MSQTKLTEKSPGNVCTDKSSEPREHPGYPQPVRGENSFGGRSFYLCASILCKNILIIRFFTVYYHNVKDLETGAGFLNFKRNN